MAVETRVGSLKANDTAERDTPAAAATSLEVARPRPARASFAANAAPSACTALTLSLTQCEV
ncbi:hypothetical protein KRMM14A1259_12690 [Krasilnikovia sp. MM14-A1259]